MQAHVTDEPTKLGNARAPRCDGRAGIGVLVPTGTRSLRCTFPPEPQPPVRSRPDRSIKTAALTIDSI